MLWILPPPFPVICIVSSNRWVTREEYRTWLSVGTVQNKSEAHQDVPYARIEPHIKNFIPKAILRNWHTPLQIPCNAAFPQALLKPCVGDVDRIRRPGTYDDGLSTERNNNPRFRYPPCTHDFSTHFSSTGCCLPKSRKTCFVSFKTGVTLSSLQCGLMSSVGSKSLPQSSH